MSKKRPVIDAILRGVYFKEEPLDLDKGKYENRLQLLKVPRLTKERILRVAPEVLEGARSTNKIIDGDTLTGIFNTSDHLYNQLTIRIYADGFPLSLFDVEIKLLDNSGYLNDLIYTNVVNYERVFVQTYTFNPAHYINYYFKNNSGFTVYLDYTFTYSELEQPFICGLDSKVLASTSKLWYFVNHTHFWNRMKLQLYSSAVLNCNVILKCKTNHGSMWDEAVNANTTAGTKYSQQYSFDVGNMWQLDIVNSSASEVFFQILLFFSNDLLPEIETVESDLSIHEADVNAHIDNLTDITTRNHSALQNIGANDHIDNLTDITTRNHSALQNIGANDHYDHDNYIHIRDQKAAGTQSGTFSQGAWRTRILNTKVTDEPNACTLSSNQFTLIAGTYRIFAIVPSFEVQGDVARLRNITDGTTELAGLPQIGARGSVTSSNNFIIGKFTITSSKTFEIQHYGALTTVTHGFGYRGNRGEIEIYCNVELWKES